MEEETIALTMRVPDEDDPYWDIFLSPEELAQKYPDDVEAK
jgi:hypothetical protein